MAESNKIEYNRNANRAAFEANGFNTITSAGPEVAIATEDRFVLLKSIGDVPAVFNFVNEVENGIKSATGYTLEIGDVLGGYFQAPIVTQGKLKVTYA